MSTRVHTTSLAFMNVATATADQLVEAFGEEFQNIEHALVIEDPGNCEAWVIAADPSTAVALHDAFYAAFEPRFIARFTPQAWVRDYALDIDPQGDTEWDVTAAFNALDTGYRAKLLAEMGNDNGPGPGEALDTDDCLMGDPNSPEWIRDFHGPFSIHVRRAS